MLFSCEILVRFYHCDPLGILFFGSIYQFFHNCMEDFLVHQGLPLVRILEDFDFTLPIVHSEADYHHPLHAGDRITVSIEKIVPSTHSFRVFYNLEKENILCACGSTVHTSISKKTWHKISLPAELKEVISSVG